MKTIKVTDARYGGNLHTGLNGRLHRIQLGQQFEASDELIEHLRGLGATVEVVSGRAGSHQEGSGGGPALSPEFAKFDRNGDGRPGGSKKRAAPKKKPASKAAPSIKASASGVVIKGNKIIK